MLIYELKLTPKTRQKVEIRVHRWTLFKKTFRRFTCLKIAVLFTGSFQAVLFTGSFQAVLFLLTPAEKRAFSQLNAVISAEVSKKKNRLKRTSKKKRTAILRRVNQLIINPESRSTATG